MNIDNGLMKPRDFTSFDYKLDFDTPNTIKAIGYGNDHQSKEIRLI